MTIEYRDDDVDRGFCPTCGRELTNLMRDGAGHCVEHGYVYAEWKRVEEEEEEED